MSLKKASVGTLRSKTVSSYRSSSDRLSLSRFPFPSAPAVQKLPEIGASYQGGYFAGQISTSGSGVADYNIVVAPVSSGESSSKQWKTTNTNTAGTDSFIDGPSNSSTMNNASHPAAQFCEGLSIGGYTDWYMPALNELEVCYYNLKPTTEPNSTTSPSDDAQGGNPNAVPSRASTKYTSGTPAQTLATDFKDTGAEDFNAVSGQLYWSSTQYVFEGISTRGWGIGFINGNQNRSFDKADFARVRAIRRVPV